MISALNPYAEMKDSGVEWLGEVPAHWVVVPLKRLGKFRSGSGFPIEAQGETGNEILFAKVSDMNRAGNEREVCHAANTVSPEAALRLGAQVFGRGTIIFPKVGGALLTNKRRLLVKATCIDNNIMACEVTGAELEFSFRLLGWLDIGRLAQPGPVPAIGEGEVREIRVALPPLGEQTAIARFMDHATGRIERYIRAKETLIALLEEQKQVIVQEAVTGRIDIRSGQPYPAYKPSSVEWLGKIPSHWDVRRAKRVFRPRNEYARPGDTQLSATQAFGVIAQAKYEEKIGRKVTRILRHLEKRQHVEVNDFVISMRSFQGGLERAWESGCIRSSYIVLRPITKVDVDYFSHLFKSCGYITALQITANFIRDGQDLNYNNFCGVDLPFPPRSEQQEIAEALGRRTENTRLSIRRTRREIELMREFRTRLIADVVTGKLDVRDAAPELPDVEPYATNVTSSRELDMDDAEPVGEASVPPVIVG